MHIAYGKKVSLKKSITVWFQLYDMSEKGKLVETEKS